MAGSLVLLAPGVYAWLADGAAPTTSNAGVVIASDGFTLIDSCEAPSCVRPLVSELAAITDLPARRLVFTGSHIDQVGGSGLFPLAAVYGTGQTSHHLDQPPNPDVWRRLHPALAVEYAELVTRPVSHTITEAAHVCPASIAVPVGGFQFENLIVQVPAASVVFAGVLASFGTVPLGFESDFPAWIESLELIKGWGDLIVPGHGPIGGSEEVTMLQNYLQSCIDARGSLERLADGPWSNWTNPERSEVNVQRAAMLADGDPTTPPALLALLGLA